jgi:tocopherol cyclase
MGLALAALICGMWPTLAASAPISIVLRQVLMAHGRATGWIEWGGERFDFEDAPSYAEKNWGGGFPDKWFWVQCESFEGGGMSGLTVAGVHNSVLSAWSSVRAGL